MKAQWFDRDVLSTIQTLANEGMKDACEIFSKNIKTSMVEGDYRRWPSKRPGGGTHWSSRPGTPPAPDTEELKDSICWVTSTGDAKEPESYDPLIDFPQRESTAIVGRIGTTNFKGVVHELRLLAAHVQPKVARPFLRPQLGNSHILLQSLKRYLGK